MSSKRQQTMAKMARERTVRERREKKQEKKRLKRLAAAEGGEAVIGVDGEVEDGVEAEGGVEVGDGVVIDSAASELEAPVATADCPEAARVESSTRAPRFALGRW